MSSFTTPKSDRSQTIIAVLFMSLFAAFVLGIASKDSITGFVCQYESFNKICATMSSLPPRINPDKFVTTQINSACVNDQGLQISVVSGPPLFGKANIQVFTTGEDVFPSESGMEDSFRMSMAIPDAADQLGFIIPVESMPVGEHIFGNIVVEDAGVIFSHVAFFIQISDCSAIDTAASNPTLITDQNLVPTTYRATCLPDNRQMVEFEFDKPVFGQYQALVGNLPYQLVSVGNQPAILFFSGDSPPAGVENIKLISATDQTVIFDETYTPPVCEN